MVDIFLQSSDHHHGLIVAVTSPVPTASVDLGMDAMLQASGAIEPYYTRTPSEDEALRYVGPV